MALALALALGPAAAMAQNIETQTKPDPRRTSGGAAKVTTETNAKDAVEDKRDEDKVDDAYQPKGVELGEFLLLPTLAIEEQYNTNVFAQPSNAKSDFITHIVPEFQLRSRFKEHALNFTGRLEQVVHWTYGSDNHLDANFGGDGRYDFTKSWEGTGAAEVFQRYEDRSSPDNRGGKTPTKTYGFTGATATKAQFGDVTFSGGVDLARRLFDNTQTSGGAPVINTDRDRWELEATARGSYEIFPGYAAVLETKGNARMYDQEFDHNGYNRSSSGWRAQAGVGVDISQLIRGDFLVGYLQQYYRDARLPSPSGPALKSVFNWTPTRLTLVVLSLERAVMETTSPGASAAVHTGGSVVVRHELDRNIVLTGVSSVFQDKYDGISQTNWTYEAVARGVYAFSREVFAGGEIGYRKRTSNVATYAYEQGVVMLRVGIRM